MEQADMDAVMTIEKKSGPPVRSRQVWQREFAAPAFSVWLATQADRPIGYLCYSLVGDEASINHLAVLPAFRRSGVAQALIGNRLENWVGDGVAQVYLEVRQSNHAARALYHRCGFLKQGVRRDYYNAPRENAVIYRYAP